MAMQDPMAPPEPATGLPRSSSYIRVNMFHVRHHLKAAGYALSMLTHCATLGQTAQIWTATGDSTSMWFGWSVSRAGDVNGDGYEELIIGAPWGRKNLNREGKVFVYWGSPGGLNSASYWTVVGGQYNAQLGRSVAGGGDLNGDGFDDIAAGAQYFDNGQTDEGAVFVHHGSPDGLSVLPDLMLESDQANAMYGASVAIPGDVNGDGYDDLLVGAPYYNDSPVNEGTAFLYYGSATGVGSAANWTFDTQQASSYARVYSVGDVNSDGFADFAVTSTLYDDGQTDEGRVFLFHGSATGPGTLPNWEFSPNDDYSYTDVAASAGDVNSDGYGDVIIGAHGFGYIENNLTGNGAAYLFFGSAAGLGPTHVWTEACVTQGSSYGSTVCGVGDANGDGQDDVLVGDRDRWADSPQEGGVTVYTGSTFGLDGPPLFDEPGGQSGGRYGHAACGGMDTNGDGAVEWLVGMPYPTMAGGAVFLYQWSEPSTDLGDMPHAQPDALIVRYGSEGPTVEMSGAFGALELLIMDAQGQVVAQRSWSGEPMPFRNLAPGLYTARVVSDKQQWTRKIIVDRR